MELNNQKKQKKYLYQEYSRMNFAIFVSRKINSLSMSCYFKKNYIIK